MAIEDTRHSDSRSTQSSMSYPAPAPTGHHSSVGPDAPFASGVAAPPHSGPIRTKTKPSKLKPSRHLSKSVSTPQLRGPAMSDAELDKKRNKLGYQRISIACAHCRRRKIRCLVADNDTEGRCQNCIRLKKECVFYPVDQNTAIDGNPVASTNTGAPPSEPSSTVSTSPSQADLKPFEHHGQQFVGGFQTVPSFSNYQSISSTPSAVLQPQGDYAASNSGYPSHTVASASWSSQDIPAHNQPMPIRASTHVAPQWTRYGSPHIAAEAAPYTETTSHQQRMLHPIQTYGYAPENIPQQWPQSLAPLHQPVRSMSVPSHPNHDFQAPYHQSLPGSDRSLRSPYELQSDGRMVPVPLPSNGMPVYAHPYMVQDERRTPSSPFGPPPPFQPPMPHNQANWYGNASPYAQDEERRMSDGRSQQNAYHGRPR